MSFDKMIILQLFLFPFFFCSCSLLSVILTVCDAIGLRTAWP